MYIISIYLEKIFYANNTKQVFKCNQNEYAKMLVFKSKIFKNLNNTCYTIQKQQTILILLSFTSKKNIYYVIC